MENNIENLINQDYLKDTMTFISLYTMTYESMVDYVVSQIHDFLCDMSVEEGKLHFIETPEYKAQIKNRRVDEKGNKDVTKASFLWLKDNNAITEEDYKSFINIKNKRNTFAHEMFQKVAEGITGDEVDCLVKMILLYKKISNWWFINIECSIMGYELREDVDINGIQSDTTFILDIIRDVIFNGKSNEYQEILNAYKDGAKNEV